jgi:hypothetical protein
MLRFQKKRISLTCFRIAGRYTECTATVKFREWLVSVTGLFLFNHVKLPRSCTINSQFECKAMRDTAIGPLFAHR